MITSARPPLRPLATGRGTLGEVRTVLLGVDARYDCGAAAERAIAQAVSHHARLVALLVLPPQDGAPAADGDGPVPAYLDRLVRRARAAGIDASYRFRFGDPGETILHTARDVEADLIVVRCDSTCGHLVLHSDRPVLVVQPWAPVSPMPAE